MIKSFINSTKKVALALLVATFFTSCLQYKDLDVKDVKDYKIEKVSTKKVVIKVDIDIVNSNNYRVVIKSADIDLFLSGKKIGKSVLDEKVIIPKNSTTTHTFYINTTLTKAATGLFTGALSLITDNGAEIRAKGYIKGRALGVSRKIPVNFKKEIGLNEIMQLGK